MLSNTGSWVHFQSLAGSLQSLSDCYFNQSSPLWSCESDIDSSMIVKFIYRCQVILFFSSHERLMKGHSTIFYCGQIHICSRAMVLMFFSMLWLYSVQIIGGILYFSEQFASRCWKHVSNFASFIRHHISSDLFSGFEIVFNQVCRLPTFWWSFYFRK